MRSVDGGRRWGKQIAIGRSSGKPVNDPVTQNILETIGTLAITDGRAQW
jgi:hypothetical protein